MTNLCISVHEILMAKLDFGRRSALLLSWKTAYLWGEHCALFNYDGLLLRGFWMWWESNCFYNQGYRNADFSFTCQRFLMSVNASNTSNSFVIPIKQSLAQQLMWRCYWKAFSLANQNGVMTAAQCVFITIASVCHKHKGRNPHYF